MSCECSKKGTTTVKLQTCDEFRLKKQEEVQPISSRNTDLLSWTGV